MVGVLEQLRENRSTRRSIKICLNDASLSDHELALALQANEHVRDLHFIIQGTRRCGWESLLRVIATREILTHVAVWGHVDDDEDPQAQTTRTNKFLHAIQVNSAIQVVILVDVRVSAASIASFLLAATSVTELVLLGIRMEANERERGARELAAALQCNTHVRTLVLGNVKDVELLPILSGLATNTHIKRLALGCRGHEDISLGASTALKRMLETTATATIFELHLNGYRFKADSFCPIAQGLIDSESITNVIFNNCSFKDEESALAFENILLYKSNVHALTIRKSNVHGRTLPATLFTNILRPESPLRLLTFKSDLLTDDGFTSLLSLVEKSKVEDLDIGEISGQHKFLALIASIPKMRIKALHVGMSRVDARDWSSALVRAVKMNSSLRSVVVDEGGGFNENQRRKLNCYFARNEGLSKWTAAPATIPKCALPKAIEAARTIGPDAIVGILHTLGSSVGPVEGKRSRKRPRFYTPTW
jgi:hypothetical protein